jgi:hypothetical protein
MEAVKANHPSVGTTAAVPAPRLEMEYAEVLELRGMGPGRAFRRTLSGLAVDAVGRIYVLADGEVVTFSPDGDLVRNWRAPEGALCIAVDQRGRIYLGASGNVEIFGSTGNRVGGFGAGESGKPAVITAIRVSGRNILVADAAARYIRRFSEDGKNIGEIGTQNKTRGFMLPNRFLDMAVDSKGMVRATDSGRHRVSSWNLDGTPAGYFGKFGLANAEDFVGCCNPVNIAVAPDGKIVTAEKVAARVKVFDAAGKLISLIGSEHFDPQCVHLFLDVDTNGRIVVGDPVRLAVKVFAAAAKTGGREQA